MILKTKLFLIIYHTALPCAIMLFTSHSEMHAVSDMQSFLAEITGNGGKETEK